MRVLRELHYRGTMSAVAEAMSYSTSAVSQQLAALETELGITLLEREGRRVRLTPEALILVRYTDDILRQLEEAAAAMESTDDELRGSLTVASMQTVILALLPHVLDELAKRHPRLEVTVVQAEPDTAIPRLLVGDFDLVVGESYPEWPNIPTPGVSVEVVALDPLRLAVAPGFWPGERPGVLAELSGAQWAVEPVGTPAHDWLTYLCRRSGFTPVVAMETADMIAQARFAAAGRVVAALPDLLWSCVPRSVDLYDLGPLGYREIQTSVRVGAESSRAIVEIQAALSAAARKLKAESSLDAPVTSGRGLTPPVG